LPPFDTKIHGGLHEACCSKLKHSVISAVFGFRKSGEISHSIHIEVIWLVFKLSLVPSAFMAVVDVPNQERHVNAENDEAYRKH